MTSRLLAILCLTLLSLGVSASDSRSLSGSLIYRERIALAPDAELRLEVRDATGRLLSTTRRPSKGAQVPLPFSLNAPGERALWLRGALEVGEKIRWLTDPLAIAPGSEALDVGELMLRAYRPLGLSDSLSCGEVEAELSLLGEQARLRIGGAYFDLAPTITASGAKFVSPADAETWIWSKGEAATLSLSGKQLPDCQPLLPEPLYRAQGNEPGWTIEIAGGQMRYSGDYGATRINASLPDPIVLDGALRYAPEGADLALTLTPALCHDSMSGLPYPHSVTLDTGGARLSGCAGAPLDLLNAHAWDVATIGGAPVLADSQVSLQFLADGRMAGSSGCNRYHGGYELSGEGLRFGQTAATLMACPEALMEQEQRFFEALARIERFDIAPDGQLQLIAGDQVVLSAQRADSR